MTICGVRKMNKTVLVLGDSHSRVFTFVRYKRMFCNFTFKVIDVGGATASGLENPNSKTNAYNIFKAALEREKYDYVLTMLGEVDTGFVIWYRCLKNEIELSESLAKTINTYCHFLDGINSRKIVVSAPLPTIRDNQDWGEVANLRKEVKATQKERTLLTLKFNTKIQAYCAGKNIKYLNLDPFVLGSDGLLKDEYYALDKTDHHYSQDIFVKLIQSKLSTVL
jgi:hypothetical protein